MVNTAETILNTTTGGLALRGAMRRSIGFNRPEFPQLFAWVSPSHRYFVSPIIGTPVFQANAVIRGHAGIQRRA